MPAKKKQTVFGIAMRNFTKYPEMPSAQGLIEYGMRMEELGYELVWAWDHILLGVDPNFPIHEALTILTAIAARTTKIKVGTGILVMPMRNPVILAKELATIDHISNGRLLVGAAVGWYKREFDSMGVEFTQRGKIMEQSLEIINRLWTEDKVDGDYPPYKLRGAVLYPKPVQKPRPPHADRRLRRCGAEARRHQGRRLADLLLHGRELRARLGQGARLRRGGRPQPRRADLHQPAADLHRPARQDRGADEALAADRVGLRLLVGIDHGQRHHGHASTSASSSWRRTSPPASIASSSFPTSTRRSRSRPSPRRSSRGCKRKWHSARKRGQRGQRAAMTSAARSACQLTAQSPILNFDGVTNLGTR